MKKMGFFLFMIFWINICTACNHEKQSIEISVPQKKHHQNTEIPLYKNIEFHEDEKILLYSIPNQKLGIYNKKTFNWTPLYKGDNLFQYVFQNESQYVVSGHSVENGFVLLKIDDDKKSMTKIFDLNNPKESFFPLANYGNQLFYVLYEDEKKSKTINRSIVTFNENQIMQKILSANDLITYGIVINHYLYYTVYEPNKDDYSVYSINLVKNEKEPQLIKTNLETRELFNIDNKLYFSNRNKIFNEEQSFTKKDENFVVGNLLIQMYANANQDLVCSIMNIKSGQILNTYKEPINFEVKNQFLYLYTNSYIYELEIGE